MKSLNLARLSGVSDAAGARLSPITRLLLGAALGIMPLVISILMAPTHRSPYLLAYPAVLLSAWLWGVPGAVACASVAGAAIEYFIFATHRIDLAPTASGWMARETMFVGGSILAGALTRRAAQQRERIATAKLQQEVARVEAERHASAEKERATELLQENEVRALMALDGANAGVWEWNIRANTSKWSAGFYRMHGLEPGSKADYDLWRSRVHPDDIVKVEHDLQLALANVGRFSSEYRVQQPGVDVRWVMCEGTTSAGPDGKAAVMRGYCGEITRRKQAEAALVQSEKLALAGRLSASIAHEINNPLDAAMNLMYLAAQTPADTEQAKLIESAMEQMTRIAQISRQTLSFSRTTERITVCRPKDLVERTLQLLQPRLAAASITVSLQVRADRCFNCSSSEVQQILTNIIANAADAIGRNGILRIRLHDSLDWRTRAIRGTRITVADTGSGMTPEVRANCFRPFFTTKEDTGTGLGMWIVSELLAKHRGHMSVSSSTAPAHHGTVISLFFPAEV